MRGSFKLYNAATTIDFRDDTSMDGGLTDKAIRSVDSLRGRFMGSSNNKPLVIVSVITNDLGFEQDGRIAFRGTTEGKV